MINFYFFEETFKIKIKLKTSDKIGKNTTCFNRLSGHHQASEAGVEGESNLITIVHDLF